MAPTSVLVLLTVMLILTLASGMELAFGMGIVGTIGLLFWHTGWPSLVALGEISWDIGTSYSLTAVPLFIFMSAFLIETGFSEGLYTAIAKWFYRVPGGLAVASQVACSIFAAISGSSVATAYAIGLIAIPEMKKRNYDVRLAAGSICAGGTLGILIPPSIPMIVYGSMMDVSIGKLFIAGVIPGIILTGIFILYILARVLANPALAPLGYTNVSWRERFDALTNVVPILGVIIVVLGSIYGGVATPTEAAALGVTGSALIAGLYRRVNFDVIKRSMFTTVYSVGMIFPIIICALIFAHIITYLHIPQAFTQLLLGLQISRWTIFAIVCILYIILGCFMETIAILVITIPIIGPMLVSLGFDPIWFGVILIILIEMGLITPPVGLNLFVVQGILDREKSFQIVSAGSMPFVVLLAVMLLILTLFPALVLWLPSHM